MVGQVPSGALEALVANHLPTLEFTDGQTNYEVLQRELVQLDVMTANRDRVVWAAAAGETIEPDDSNVPEPIEVVSNLAEPQFQDGVSKTGTLDFLGGEEAIERMELEDGMYANLFASEEMFPELINPVQLGVDTRGRLWAATWATYPKWEPTKEMDDRLLIFPDDDRDGVALALVAARVLGVGESRAASASAAWSAAAPGELSGVR